MGKNIVWTLLRIVEMRKNDELRKKVKYIDLENLAPRKELKSDKF